MLHMFLTGKTTVALKMASLLHRLGYGRKGRSRIASNFPSIAVPNCCISRKRC
ncbi:hypothetical protein [Paracoccus everestensis]|uniref:hypothetical protein n=1 Tax=Paracoccus everestensis TaxID=2903900 RepID=UPI0028F41C4D|nr:hypothetical protein [Paracoccus everestensis]